MRIERLVRCAIDMRVHVGPECIARKYDAIQFAKEALRRGIAGAVLKSHFQPTSDWAYLARKHIGAKFFGAIALNRHVGGLNPYAIRAALGPRIGDEPLLKVVWMPTIHSKSHLALRVGKGGEYDIPTEWGGAMPGCGRRASEIDPVEVTAEGARPALEEVLSIIKEFDLVLATGHLHREEVEYLFERAKGRGLRRILITHPLYEAVNMPLEGGRRHFQEGGIYRTILCPEPHGWHPDPQDGGMHRGRWAGEDHPQLRPRPSDQPKPPRWSAQVLQGSPKGGGGSEGHKGDGLREP